MKYRVFICMSIVWTCGIQADSNLSRLLGVEDKEAFYDRKDQIKKDTILKYTMLSLIAAGAMGYGGLVTKNNAGYYHGSDNLLGMMSFASIVAGFVVARMRYKHMSKGMDQELEAYQKRVMQFLETWKEHREQFPPELQASVDNLVQWVNEHKGVVEPIYAYRLCNAFEAFDELERSNNFEIRDDIDRWLYVLTQFDAKTLKHKNSLWWYVIKNAFKSMPKTMTISLAPFVSALLSMRFNPVKVSKDGVIAEVISSVLPKKSTSPTSKEEKELDPKAVISFVGTYGGSFLVINAFISFAWYFFNKYAKDYDAYVADMQGIDSFIAAWPLVKEKTPEELHDYLDGIYERFYDKETMTVNLSVRQRWRIVSFVTNAAKPFKAEIKKRRDAKRSYLTAFERFVGMES